MKFKFEWERIKDTTTCRAKVIGGWIVSNTPKYTPDMFLEDPVPFATALVFIDDPQHQWEIE